MINFDKPLNYLELFYARIYGVLMTLSFCCREFVIVSRFVSYLDLYIFGKGTSFHD